MTARDWDIPILDPAWACTVQSLPAAWIGWGKWCRRDRIAGRGVHHYRADPCWSAHWKHPDTLPNLGVSVGVECNYSTFDGYPRALALGDLYRKRWLAAHWGRRGVKLLVDLNVDPAFRDLMLLGVPAGWPSYATRHHVDVPIAELEADHAAALAHCGREPLFVVFGGDRRVRDLCRARGWPRFTENFRRRGQA